MQTESETNRLPVPTSGLPIPDYLIPPGVSIRQTPNGPFHSISDSYESMRNDKEFLPWYQMLVSRYLREAYPDLDAHYRMANNPSLTADYCEYLLDRFQEVQYINTWQNLAAIQGNFSFLVEHRDWLKKTFYPEFTFKEFLISRIAAKYAKLHPDYRPGPHEYMSFYHQMSFILNPDTASKQFKKSMGNLKLNQKITFVLIERLRQIYANPEDFPTLLENYLLNNDDIADLFHSSIEPYLPTDL